MSHTHLHLYKENFKFSSAHFLIFDQHSAEMLHGHNYAVRIDLQIGERLQGGANGYSVNFSEIKKIVKDQLDEWDEHVLLPKNQPDMKFLQDGKALHVWFRDRFYAFPSNEVVLLPTTNTSVEELSRILAGVFAEKFFAFGFSEFSISVEETLGQSASCTLSAASYLQK